MTEEEEQQIDKDFFTLLKQDYEHFSNRINLEEWRLKCLCMLKEQQFDDLRAEIERVKLLLKEDSSAKSFFREFEENDLLKGGAFISLSKMADKALEKRVHELTADAAGSAFVSRNPKEKLFIANKLIHQEEVLAVEEKVAIETVCLKATNTLSKQSAAFAPEKEL